MSKQLTDADLTRMGCANELSDTERGQLIGEVIRLQGVNAALVEACDTVLEDLWCIEESIQRDLLLDAPIRILREAIAKAGTL